MEVPAQGRHQAHTSLRDCSTGLSYRRLQGHPTHEVPLCPPAAALFPLCVCSVTSPAKCRLYHLLSAPLPAHAQWQLKYPEELIAVAHGPDLVAAAGKSWLVFADPREPGDRSSQSLTCHAHHDDEGVRSLKLNDHIVSCGELLPAAGAAATSLSAACARCALLRHRPHEAELTGVGNRAVNAGSRCSD
jgi:hypothetical protein